MRILPIGSKPPASLLALAFLPAFPALSIAQASKPAQVLILTNPTPRQPDLELMFNKTSPAGSSADHATLQLNAQRQALVTKASGQLTLLATALHDGLAKHKDGETLAPELQVADLIEKLAHNVNASLQLGAASSHPSRTEPRAAAEPAASSSAQLAQDSEKLVALTHELQADVTTMNGGSVSLGAVSRSEQVARLAGALKQRLK